MNSGYYYAGDYNTSYGVSNTAGLTGAMAGFGTFFLIFYMAIGILMIISLWKIFTKAGKPGWAAIVPIYNVYIMCEIAEKPWWYILLLLVPFANIYAIVMIYDGISKKFGKSTSFTVGMFFLSFIFFPILAFGKNSVYVDGVNNININNTQNEIVDENINGNAEVSNADVIAQNQTIDSINIQNNMEQGSIGATPNSEGSVESTVYEAPQFDSMPNNVNMENNVVQNPAPAPVNTESAMPQFDSMPNNVNIENNVVQNPAEAPVNQTSMENNINNLQPEVQVGNETHTSLWSNNNNNNGNVQ